VLECLLESVRISKTALRAALQARRGLVTSGAGSGASPALATAATPAPMAGGLRAALDARKGTAPSSSSGRPMDSPASLWSGLAVKKEEAEAPGSTPAAVVDLRGADERPQPVEQRPIQIEGSLAADRGAKRSAAEASSSGAARGDFNDASEEQAAKRDSEAAKLLRLLPAFCLQVAGGRGSSEPPERYEAAAIRRLSGGIGGKGAAATTEARLFLGDLRAARGEGVALFPITTADASSLLDRLVLEGKPTAAGRVACVRGTSTRSRWVSPSLAGARLTPARRGRTSPRNSLRPPWSASTARASGSSTGLSDSDTSPLSAQWGLGAASWTSMAGPQPRSP
jgi:hypothetical protein